MENLNTALLLMVVGMTTVFAILLIVIYLGKGLILLVNKYAPEEVVPDKKGAQGPAAIPGNILAAITPDRGRRYHANPSFQYKSVVFCRSQ